MRTFICGKHLARVAEVDHQNGDAETVVTSTMLPHKGKVIARERDQPNQLALVLWKGEQLKSFCGGQQFAARHSTPTFSNTLNLFFKSKVARVAMSLPDQSKHRQHVIRDGVIHIPEIDKVPAPVLFSVMPGQEEIGHPA